MFNYLKIMFILLLLETNSVLKKVFLYWKLHCIEGVSFGYRLLKKDFKSFFEIKLVLPNYNYFDTFFQFSGHCVLFRQQKILTK